MNTLDALKSAECNPLKAYLVERVMPKHNGTAVVEPATHVLITVDEARFVLGILNLITRLKQESTDDAV